MARRATSRYKGGLITVQDAEVAISAFIIIKSFVSMVSLRYIIKPGNTDHPIRLRNLCKDPRCAEKP